MKHRGMIYLLHVCRRCAWFGILVAYTVGASIGRSRTLVTAGSFPSCPPRVLAIQVGPAASWCEKQHILRAGFWALHWSCAACLWRSPIG